jgi:hypothetical protein
MDTFFANHALLTSGAINLAQNADTTITVNAQYPILAFTGTGPISILSAQLSGGTWSFDLFCQATGGCVGTYYVFDVVQDASPGYPFSIGLRLRNPDTGAITYRSDRKYMRVVNVRTMEMPTPVKLSAPISEALPQAGLAAVIANPGGRVQTRTISITLPDGTRGDATEYTPYQLAATVNGTTLLYGSNDTRFTTINEGNDQLDVPCTLLLVDISNF